MSGRVKPAKAPNPAAIDAAISALHALAAAGALEVRLATALQAMAGLIQRDLGPDFAERLSHIRAAAKTTDADKLGEVLADLLADVIAEGAFIENRRSQVRQLKPKRPVQDEAGDYAVTGPAADLVTAPAFL